MTEAAAGRRPAAAARCGLTTTLALLAAAALPAQRDPHRPPQRTVETAIDFSTGQDDNLFSVLRSQDNIHAFEEGLGEIAAGEVRAGVERLHRLLQTENGGVVPVAPGRFLGLRLAVVTAMANLSPAQKSVYEDLVQREGGAVERLDELSAEQLMVLAERFPTAAVGQRARLRLGDLALTAGDGRSAQGHFRAALDATPIGSTEEQRAAARLYAADVLCDPAAARAARSLLDPAEPAAAADDDGDVLAVVPLGASTHGWTALGGGQSGRTPMTPLRGRPDTRWNEDIVAPGFRERDIANYAMHAVGDVDGIFVNTGQFVVAFDPLRRDMAWVSTAPMRDHTSGETRGRGRADDGINEDMVLAAACGGDVVVAALQVPDKSATVDFHGGYRVMSKIPMRRLFAFSRQTGKVLWAHFDEVDGPRTRRFKGHDACANPIIAGDTVYVPIHDRSGAIAFAVAAYDLRTGQPKWRRLVCSSQQDVNMFGNARAEFAASPLCLESGVLFGASNLGVAYAIEANTGRLRWLSSYEVVRMPRTMMQHQQDRQVFFANNAPVAADGVVCLTPLDSPYVLGLDMESGRRVWRLPPDANVDGVNHRYMWLAGALGDEFVLSGVGAIAVRARGQQVVPERPQVRQLARPDAVSDRRSGHSPTRPAVTSEGVWFARADGLVGVDPTGAALPSSPVRLERFQPGNLLLVAGLVVSLRQRSLEIAYDAAALRDHVETAAAARPDDPALLLRLATLRRALLGADAAPDALAAVHTLYQRGLDAAIGRGLPPTHPVRMALQRELFDQARELAESAGAAGSPEALTLFAAARDAAPDQSRWLEMQALVLARSAGEPERFAAELERMLARAPDGTFPLGEGVPVRTFVAWQQARTATAPADAVARWQDLLENHGAQLLEGTAAATLARQAIDELVQRHGAAVYAPVQARADAALVAAGEDRSALAAVAARFPNSPAAASARSRLLDTAVRAGDLAVASSVLAQSLADGRVAPGVLRRVLVAAGARGNHGLAAAMAERLRAHGAERSDWPEDGGRSYADVLAALPPPPAAAPGAATLQLPAADATTFRARSATEQPLLVPVLPPETGALPADLPLYVKADRELLAVDVHARGDDKPVLFTTPVDFLEHVLVVGTALIVPDWERVFAVDYRTGQLLWELPNPQKRLLESQGLLDGVLHVRAQPRTADGEGELFGIEPTSGVVLFGLALGEMALRPKSTTGGLLQITVQRDGGAAIARLDPISGRPLQTTNVAAATLQPHLVLEADSLSTRELPQHLASDGTRLFVPADAPSPGEPARVLALGADGAVAWTWRGTAGGQLPMVARRGDLLVLVEAHERKPSRALALRCADGAVVREAEIGLDPRVLNWTRSWLATEAPPVLAIEAFGDTDRTQRQFVAFAVAADQPSFVLGLGREDGEILATPQFGDDFATFCTRPAKGSGGVRLWAVALRDRAGMLADGRKYRTLGNGFDGMARFGDRVVVTGAPGILLTGATRGTR